EGVSLRSDPHRHDQVLVRGVRSPFEGLLAAHHRWLDGVGEGQAGEVGTQGAQAVEQEPGVEADHQILPLELCLEHFAGLASSPAPASRATWPSVKDSRTGVLRSATRETR